MNYKRIAYLNSNDGTGILAFGEGPTVSAYAGNALQDLHSFLHQNKHRYLFGYLGYDLKNEIEDLNSLSTDNKSFPDLMFWNPCYVVRLKNNVGHWIQGEKDEQSSNFVNDFISNEVDQEELNIHLAPQTSKKEYLNQVNSILSRLQQGDIYEVNYCQEFLAEGIEIKNPIGFYKKLNEATTAPFSSYLGFEDKHIFCGSPERFIKRTEDKIISQPIKGTARRHEDQIIDAQLLSDLKNDPKERSENVMIVDLVRNDLSKIATPKSVKVDELFKVTSFKTVHQMISTVSCEVKSELQFVDIIKATFPMGSMTGAPKVKAMEIIEELESFKRNSYSGAIGYLAPNGDFDFNVVIRSMFYNEESKKLTCDVRGAITINSVPEKEYQECFTKIEALLNGIKSK